MISSAERGGSHENRSTELSLGSGCLLCNGGGGTAAAAGSGEAGHARDQGAHRADQESRRSEVGIRGPFLVRRTSRQPSRRPGGSTDEDLRQRVRDRE